MVALRWPDGVRCPTCENETVSFLEHQGRWQCSKKHPKRQFSTKVGTIFEDSPIGLDKWLPAVWEIVNCKNGISSYKTARALSVTQKTAWFMSLRIRLAMHTGSFEKMVDHAERYVDGNVHTNKIENFWSLLKRGEQAFRFNERKGTDADRFAKAMRSVTGRRVTYKQLIGESEAPPHKSRQVEASVLVGTVRYDMRKE